MTNCDAYNWKDGAIETRKAFQVVGQWPNDLEGRFLRNGPALFQRGEESKNHLLDGDGLIQCWQLSSQGISYRSRFVETKKFVHEQSSGKFLYSGLGSNNKQGQLIRRPDDINTANTNIIEHSQKLYALWETGSAYEIDQNSLETVGIKAWSKQTAGAPFGAHPKRDQAGVLWNIGVTQNLLILYEINAQGELRRVRTHQMVTSALVHDFAITERYLLIWLAPLTLDQSKLDQGSTLLDAMVWHGSDPSRLVVIDKNSLDRVAILEFEAELIFHFANAWDDGINIHLSYVKTTLDQLINGLALPPRWTEAAVPSESATILRHINLQTGNCSRENFPGFVEFPQIDQRWTGKQNQLTFYLEKNNIKSKQPGFNAVMCRDGKSMDQDRYVFEEGVQLEEHILVPSTDSDQEGEGWLIGTGYNERLGASFCSVFNSRSLRNGPVAIAYLDGRVPACFHGCFIRSQSKTFD